MTRPQGSTVGCDEDWSVPGDPSESELQEALSGKFSSRVVSVLPLASGRLAVIGLMRQVIGYAASLEAAHVISEAHYREVEAHFSRPRYHGSWGATSTVTEKSLDDLGL